MKLAFATTFSATDVRNWSGTPFYMSQAFKENHEVAYIGDLARKSQPFFKIKQTFKKWACGQRESPRFNVTTAKYYSLQVIQQLKNISADAVIAPQINPIAYLDCKQPLVLWTDALYASLVGFYPAFSQHSAESIRQGNLITQECLSRCTLAIFSSDWAARGALENYGVSRDKVKVVPFGANLTEWDSFDDIKLIIKNRSREKVKLLFLGKQWDRKGGDIVFKVAKALHEKGQPVELHFVGCLPPKEIEIPHYIYCYGFISKKTQAGIDKIKQLLRESHFLFVPSRAEAYGIVFCEANAFALPCLTSYVGGISTIVKDDVNGKTFALDASADLYCEYIINLMQNYSQYESLALSSFHEFETRLNWKIACKTVMNLLR